MLSYATGNVAKRMVNRQRESTHSTTLYFLSAGRDLASSSKSFLVCEQYYGSNHEGDGKSKFVDIDEVSEDVQGSNSC